LVEGRIYYDAFILTTKEPPFMYPKWPRPKSFRGAETDLPKRTIQQLSIPILSVYKKLQTVFNGQLKTV
jgi:hypothetical protein